MKLATFEFGGTQCIGTVNTAAGTVTDLQEAHRATKGNAGPFFVDMLALIEGGKAATDLAAEWCPRPGRIGIADGRRAPSASIPIPPQIRDFFYFEQHFKNVNPMAANLLGQHRIFRRCGMSFLCIRNAIVIRW